MLWLPGVLVLLCGLPALLATGQVDPRGWMLPALLLAPVAGWLCAHRSEGAACWAGAGAAGSVLCCVFLATWQVPALEPTLWFLAVVGLATVAGFAHHALGAARWLAAAGLLLSAAALWWLAKEPPIQPAAKSPRLAVITGLPLFWQGSARVDAPIIAVLRQRFDVQPVDSPLALEKGNAKSLLLAQPRAFSMDELVALDRWVRRGGTALVLADPELRWPMDWPLGDRRRPPAVTLLAGMIQVWGVKLTRPHSGELRHFLGDGRMLTVYAASGFEDAGPNCRIVARGLVARCAVGKGQAIIVADADLIDDRLWLADPAAALNPAQWTADTPQFISQMLGQPLPDRRRWVRTGAMLAGAVRWAVLVGFFWAALGTLLFGRGKQAPFALRRERLALPKSGKEH